jgi:hypothetical protein
MQQKYIAAKLIAQLNGFIHQPAGIPREANRYQYFRK